ncbi:MAG: hypothetical protein Q9165_008790, partial [Trypethelium subeluteriae]
MASAISFSDRNQGLQAGIINGARSKSQLAIEHAYRTYERSQETWVFWVHASNEARFEQSYRNIADCVKITGRQNLRANIFKLVHDWLRDSKDPWLLILDNVDDARFLLHVQVDGQGQPANDSRTASRPLHEYLPHCKHGSILITSRNKKAALQLVEQRNLIIIEPMDEAQALALFKTKLGVQENSGNIAKLAAALEYMPLAITQAAAYISRRSPRCTVIQYLEEFQNSDHGKMSLLDYNASQLRRDREAKNSIIVTWQISFHYIQRTRPSAADLLSLMSFFDRQGIPETLICHCERPQEASQSSHKGKSQAMGHLRRLFRQNKRSYKDQENYRKSYSNKAGFEYDLDILRDYSFITLVGEGTIFEMHSLVQLATRKWLDSNGKLEHWRHQSIRNLCAVFPTGEYENWAVCQTLFAHAKAASGQQPEGESSLIQWGMLLYHAAWYAWRMGNITDAETLAIKSIKARRKVLGQVHKDTLSSMGMAGLAYKLSGRWDAAEELEVQVMETSKRVLGVDHPDTLTSIANLASTFWNQGRWTEAEQLDVQVMETRKR